jgi:hypothetical protein
VVFFSFISPRTSRRYDPTHVAPERTDDDNFYAVEKSEHHVTHFALSIGPPNNDRTIENETRIVEVDLPLAQNSIAFVVVPFEFANAREQRAVIVFDHGHSPRQRGCVLNTSRNYSGTYADQTLPNHYNHCG